MLDNNKIGKFILKKRIEYNLTQEVLADKVGVTRQAVSKWERCLSIPDYDSMLILCELFNVTINEIVAGNELTNENKTEINKTVIEVLKNKDKKIRKLVLTVLIISMLSTAIILSYYFVSTYKQIHVYNIAGNGSTYSIKGIGFFANDKNYIFLNNENEYKDIVKMNLYYIYNKTKNIIESTDENYFIISEINNYNEYYDLKSYKTIIENLFIDIYFNNNEVETIKLKFNRVYNNSNIFFKNNKKVSNKKLIINKNVVPSYVKKNFEEISNEQFLYKEKLKNYDLKIIYDSKVNIIQIEEVYKNYIDNYIYYYEYDSLMFSRYKDSNLIIEKEIKEISTIDEKINSDIKNIKNYFKKKYNYLLK